jgi:bifunctional UDP-N-acetylglucosamine pyrophosphorylase / glucosamine-1-phosphate N-acetyltransferase
MKSARAKVLHEIAGRPMGYYPIRCALEAGASRVVVVVGHQADEVKRSLSQAFGSNRRVGFALQKEQRGTADAVASARAALKGFKDPIVILYGDVPLLRPETIHLLLQWRATPGRVLALVTARAADPKGYGRILRNPEGVLRVVEESDCNEAERAIDEINAGIYAASADFLWSMIGRISHDNVQRELYLTDLAEAASALAAPAVAVTVPFEEIAGVNDRADLARVNGAMRDAINHRHMVNGVTLEDPATTHLDDAVMVDEDSKIGPGAILRGSTRVGRGSTIGAGCVVENSEIGEGVEIRPYSVLESARIGPRAIIGPFARIRPGSDLGPEVHIGNFVETKKALIGKGTKANHLTYLGDCVVGRGANIGAGTITCNYDGQRKYTTELGDQVFVGSDTQFVAPVKVGNGAYIGAGSTIVEDVPAHSLAIARSRQVVKPGWARNGRNPPPKPASHGVSPRGAKRSKRGRIQK